MIKALVMFSGGLDSRLVIKILQEQKIDIIALNFDLPFGSGCCKSSCSWKFTQLQGIPLRIVDCKKGKNFQEFIKIVKSPKHGHGSGMNPCIDCRIFMLKKAKSLMKKLKADFIATGEVLDERPMSQHRKAMQIVEAESGLQGKLLRPLSAKLLPETDAEKKGLIDRNNLFGIQGRQRKQQIELANKYNMDYPSPGGGCLLCEKEYVKKLEDLFKNNKNILPEDIALLKIGRHFRFEENKIIVARNAEESQMLREFKGVKFELEKHIPGPTTLLIGKAGKEAIKKAAQLTLFHSKNKANVVYGERKFNKSIFPENLERKEVENIRIQ